MNVAEAASAWLAGGVSCIPIAPGGTKRPLVRWAEYQHRLPTEHEIAGWWPEVGNTGIALIMGAVSGGAEMLELEGRAVSSVALTEIANRADELGIGLLWNLLTGTISYSEISPSGGLHLIYRIGDHAVPGNEKIAHDADGLVLAETRGEGGYVIVAPTPGACHATGQPWTQLTGEFGFLSSITWEERCLLHLAVAQGLGYVGPSSSAAPAPSRALAPATVDVGASPSTVAVQSPAPDRSPLTRGLVEQDLRPGDLFEQQVDWADPLLLSGAGWNLTEQYATGERRWTRPGKRPGDGISATTSRASDRDRLFVFSTSTVFPAEEPITKFRAYSILHHGGDDRAAAQQLVRMGFGSNRPSLSQNLPDFSTQDQIDTSEKFYELTDAGNGQRFYDFASKRARWIPEHKSWYVWNDIAWERDNCDKVITMFLHMTEMMLTSNQETVRKWARQSQSLGKVKAGLELSRRLFAVHAEELDSQPELLNVQNGTIDLRTGELRNHETDDLITKVANFRYDPEAQCPEFLKFIEQVLPNDEVRTYVQRAIGSTLIGKVDQRALFLIHGPSGTGKSQFLELIRYLLGNYAVTAPPSTFRSKKDGAPSNDLHQLRGRRFVATSETADTSSFDEELIKRITGGDTIQSRYLYCEYEEWTPQCTIWLATNFAPRFSSDDDAIWRRAKLIPFVTKFGEPGQPDAIPDFARKRLFPEADGIFNWILAGLRDFLAYGLNEPESVSVAAMDLRAENDPVCRFVEEQQMDGILVAAPDQRIRVSELFTLYQEWTKRQGERPLGRRRFMNRFETCILVTRVKHAGQIYLIGVGRSSTASILGNWAQDRFADG